MSEATQAIAERSSSAFAEALDNPVLRLHYITGRISADQATQAEKALDGVQYTGKGWQAATNAYVNLHFNPDATIFTPEQIDEGQKLIAVHTGNA